jgi:hypothetical protein
MDSGGISSLYATFCSVTPRFLQKGVSKFFFIFYFFFRFSHGITTTSEL